MIGLRFATSDDERRLAALDRTTWSPDVAPVPLWDEERDFFAADPPRDVLVAVRDDGDRPVGYAKLRRASALESNRHVLEVGGLAVDPGSRRLGVGRRLVLAAATQARRRGARRLTLRVLGTNASARALYAACGFRVEGVRREEFVLAGRYVDDVLMARALTPPPAPGPGAVPG